MRALFFSLLLITVWGAANDSPTHAIVSIAHRGKRMSILMNDGSRFKIRPSEQPVVKALWKEGDDLILYRSLELTSFSLYWIHHCPSNTYAYARCDKVKKEEEGFKLHIEKMRPPYLIVKSNTGEKFYLKLCINPQSIQETLKGWENGTPVTFGSTWSKRYQTRLNGRFVVNCVTGDYHSANDLGKDQIPGDNRSL